MTTPSFDGLIAFYPASDLSATEDFYCRDLGLTLARDQGTCRIFKVKRGAYLGFCLHLGDPGHVGNTILTLLCDDVDAAYRRLRRLGVETEGSPRFNEQFGIYHFFAADPDGYRVELQRFATPLE